MLVSILALAAAAAAPAAAPNSGMKWVPLSTAQVPQATTQASPAVQVAPAVAAPAAPIAAPSMTSAILRVGTEVPLRLTEELTTQGKKLRVGNRFHLETSEPVIVQGVNVIPVGSPAVGEITDVRN